ERGGHGGRAARRGPARRVARPGDGPHPRLQRGGRRPAHDRRGRLAQLAHDAERARRASVVRVTRPLRRRSGGESMRSVAHTIALALLAVGLAACASGTTPVGQPTPAPPTAAAAPAATTVAAAAPPPPEQIRVSFAADGAVYAPHFIALEKGYYAEAGIEMEMVRAGGGAATPALISGEIQYSTSAGTSLSAMVKGAPLKVVYTNSDRSFDELWTTTPGVRTLQDLVGKSVGIQTRGDTTEIESRLMFMKDGIDPNTVSLNALGVGNQRLAALEAGVIPAAVLATPEVVLLKETGAGPRAQRVADFRNEIRMLYTGLATHDQELRDHKDRARRFLR